MRALCFALTVLSLTVMGCGDDDGVGMDTGADVGTDTAVDTVVDSSPSDDAEEDAAPDTGTYVDVSLYTALDTPDDELADDAVAILTGDRARCTSCHGLTQDRVVAWGEMTTNALGCVDGLDPNNRDDAESILECFRTDGTGDPEKLGLVATAPHLAWFERAFEVVYNSGAAIQRTVFGSAGQMPRPPGDPVTQDDVDVLLTWAARGMPGLVERFPGGGLDCEPDIDPRVGTHVAEMGRVGWNVINREEGVSMYGCPDGEWGRACLKELQTSDDVDYGEGWATDGTLIRILFEYPYQSAFWTRSSADGRYVAHGNSPDTDVGRAGIVDLERGVVVIAQATYDPSFFPDNSGFLIQGVMGDAGGRGGGGFCRQSLLNSSPELVTFDEPECTQLRNIGLYQHVGAVAGGDYWTVFSQFVSDNGGHSTTRDPVSAEFDANARMTMVPIVHDGSGYRSLTARRFDIPFEGDATISNSSQLVVTRIRGESGEQSGFHLYGIRAELEDGEYNVDTTNLGTYCIRGAKPDFSFDERYITFHRYLTDDDAAEFGFEDADDPAFREYRRQGAANVYLLDLLTGRTTRITTMNPGQYALFPHFRADGWVYFVVRDNPRGVETVAASNAVAE